MMRIPGRARVFLGRTLFRRITWLGTAILLLALFGVFHLLGWRDDTAFISGTPTSSNPLAAAIRGILYGLSYFSAVLVSPILILATGFHAIFRRWSNHSTRKSAMILALIGMGATCLGGRTACGADWKPTSLPSTPPAQPAIDGATWYRCYIRVPARMVVPAEKDLFRDSITLNLAAISGPFAVYLNGQKIAEGTDVPLGPRRRFKVPKDILVKDLFNTLAIRLDAKATLGATPILAGYHDELLLDGAWELTRAEVDADALKPLPKQPATAFYTESGFKPASSPLGRNAQLMPGVRVPPKESLAKLKPADDLVVDLVLKQVHL